MVVKSLLQYKYNGELIMIVRCKTNRFYCTSFVTVIKRMDIDSRKVHYLHLDHYTDL